MPSDPRSFNDDPAQAIAVSPDDQTSDRAQSDTDQALNSGKLDELISSSRELSANAAALAATSSAEIVASRKQRRRFGILLAAVGVVVIVGLITIYVSLQSGHSNSKVIKDCVEPSGQCFKDAQKRTSRLVTVVNNAALTDAGLAAACAPSYVTLPLAQRITAIHACILRNLK